MAANRPVADGAGLCIIAGLRNFGRFGLDQTVLAPTVGVYDAGTWRRRPTRWQLTPLGAEHPALRLAFEPLANADLWRLVDPLAGVLPFRKTRDGATVLARTEEGLPLVVVQRYGKGRTMLIATDSTWRWVLTPKDTARIHHRFWRQSLMWLAGQEPGGNFAMEKDRGKS